MTRAKFNERKTIETLIHQGTKLTCFRTKEPITLDNVSRLEREHIHELALGGTDTPDNCRYSLKEAHAIVTNGTKATTAGSSKHKIAKDRRLRIARQAKADVEERVGKDPGFRLKKKMDGSVVRVRTS